MDRTEREGMKNFVGFCLILVNLIAVGCDDDQPATSGEGAYIHNLVEFLATHSLWIGKCTELRNQNQSIRLHLEFRYPQETLREVVLHYSNTTCSGVSQDTSTVVDIAGVLDQGTSTGEHDLILSDNGSSCHEVIRVYQDAQGALSLTKGYATLSSCFNANGATPTNGFPYPALTPTSMVIPL